MGFKNLCVLMLWTKEASALEGLMVILKMMYWWSIHNFLPWTRDIFSTSKPYSASLSCWQPFYLTLLLADWSKPRSPISQDQRQPGNVWNASSDVFYGLSPLSYEFTAAIVHWFVCDGDDTVRLVVTSRVRHSIGPLLWEGSIMVMDFNCLNLFMAW